MCNKKRKNKEQIKKMPPFTRPVVRKWIIQNLGSGVKPSEAAEKFLKRFPDYNSEEYGDYEKRFSVVKKRFYEYNTNPRTKNYHGIKIFQASDKKDLAEIAILSDPVERLFWLENYLFSGREFTVSEELKILAEIGKLADKITAADIPHTRYSTYGGATAEFSSPGAIWNNPKKEV